MTMQEIQHFFNNFAPKTFPNCATELEWQKFLPEKALPQHILWIKSDLQSCFPTPTFSSPFPLVDLCVCVCYQEFDRCVYFLSDEQLSEQTGAQNWITHAVTSTLELKM